MIELSAKHRVVKFPNSVGNNVLVSICVQTYNHEKYISKCLDSILQQKTDFLFEVLLGEDDSRDNTRAICEQYAKAYPSMVRLFLHDRRNVIKIGGNPTGRYNMIFNLQEANGDFIALCEGDDYWCDVYKLQKQVDFLRRNDSYSFCFHRIFSVNENSAHKLPVFRGEVANKTYGPEDFIVNLPASTLSLMFRTKAIDHIPSWYIDVYGGDIFLMMLLIDIGQAYCLPDFMGVYRNHSQNITNQWARRNRYEELKLIYRGLTSFDTYTNNRFSHLIKKRKKKEYLQYKYSQDCSLARRMFYDFVLTTKYEPVSLVSIKNFFRRTLKYIKETISKKFYSTLEDV